VRLSQDLNSKAVIVRMRLAWQVQSEIQAGFFSQVQCVLTLYTVDLAKALEYALLMAEAPLFSLYAREQGRRKLPPCRDECLNSRLMPPAHFVEFTQN
jgi:hypothetical protein